MSVRPNPLTGAERSACTFGPECRAYLEFDETGREVRRCAADGCGRPDSTSDNPALILLEGLNEAARRQGLNPGEFVDRASFEHSAEKLARPFSETDGFGCKWSFRCELSCTVDPATGKRSFDCRMADCGRPDVAEAAAIVAGSAKKDKAAKRRKAQRVARRITRRRS